jgi:hypothetical protein
MRTFVTGTTRIDVAAQISGEALELDRLVLSCLEGREPSRMKHLENWSIATVANL